MRVLFIVGLLASAAIAPHLAPRGPLPQQLNGPVELNHVVVAVDEGTYAEILASSFLSTEFANGGVQTVTAGPEESWTGRYIVGENLYLEIFGPGGREGRDPGYVGLAFSTVATEDIDLVYAHLKVSAGERAYRMLRTRQVRGEDRPWFYAVSIDPPVMSRRLGAWVMEYHPNHLEALTLPSDAAPSRSAYLRALRKARGASMPPPHRLLADIRRLDLVLSADEHGDLETLLLAGGWTRAKAQADTIHLYRPGLNLYITSSPSPKQRLHSIDFRLTRLPDKNRELHFGDRSTLTVAMDGTARWTFR